MMHILAKRKGDKVKGQNPLCLVLSPTRELAQQVCGFVLCSVMCNVHLFSICLYVVVVQLHFSTVSSWCQIADVLCDTGKSCGVTTVCVYGGTSKGPQISALKNGVVRYFYLQGTHDFIYLVH